MRGDLPGATLNSDRPHDVGDIPVRNHSDADVRMKYLSAQEVADRLSISLRSVREYIKSGKLPSVKIDKLRRIGEDDLDAFIEKRKQRSEMETVFWRQQNQLIKEAAQHLANWRSKRKKLWIEEHQATNPVLSMRRK